MAWSLLPHNRMLPTNPLSHADMQDETALLDRLRALEEENARLLEEQ